MSLNEDIVKEALTWIDTPYQHRSATKQGCDCTGLIIGVMQTLGYMKDYKLRNYPKDWNLHSMADNYIVDEIEKFTDKIFDMRSGDIVLFRFGKCIAHAGILLENKLFIHSHVKAKKCNVSLMKNNEWSKRFVGAYRFNLKKVA